MARIHIPTESTKQSEKREKVKDLAKELQEAIGNWQQNAECPLLDQELVATVSGLFLQLVDDNPNRSGLIETPTRMAGYWSELLEGQKYSNQQIADMFNKCFEKDGEEVNFTSGLVVEKDVAVFSTCEHHMALMYNMKVTIAYLPKDKVIGLSKMARVVEMVAKRLQLQEKIGADISEVMSMILGTDDIAVLIEGSHACKTARGIKARESITKTASLHGKFKDSVELRQELYMFTR